MNAQNITELLDLENDTSILTASDAQRLALGRWLDEGYTKTQDGHEWAQKLPEGLPQPPACLELEHLYLEFDFDNVVNAIAPRGDYLDDDADETDIAYYHSALGLHAFEALNLHLEHRVAALLVEAWEAVPTVPYAAGAEIVGIQNNGNGQYVSDLDGPNGDVLDTDVAEDALWFPASAAPLVQRVVDELGDLYELTGPEDDIEADESLICSCFNETLRLRCNWDTCSAPVMVDYGTGDGWEPTRYQTADARSLGLEEIAIELMAEALQESEKDVRAEAEIKTSDELVRIRHS